MTFTISEVKSIDGFAQAETENYYKKWGSPENANNIHSWEPYWKTTAEYILSVMRQHFRDHHIQVSESMSGSVLFGVHIVNRSFEIDIRGDDFVYVFTTPDVFEFKGRPEKYTCSPPHREWFERCIKERVDAWKKEGKIWV